MSLCKHVYLSLSVYMKADYADYSPMWCGENNRGENLEAAASGTECFQLCGQCDAVEWWSGGRKFCYQCLNPSQRLAYTDTTYDGYPPHVLVKKAAFTVQLSMFKKQWLPQAGLRVGTDAERD